MWKEYPGAGNGFFYFPGLTQCKHSPLDGLMVKLTITCWLNTLLVIEKLYVTWLNNENLEFGGRLVHPLSVK